MPHLLHVSSFSAYLCRQVFILLVFSAHMTAKILVLSHTRNKSVWVNRFTPVLHWRSPKAEPGFLNLYCPILLSVSCGDMWRTT